MGQPPGNRMDRTFCGIEILTVNLNQKAFSILFITYSRPPNSAVSAVRPSSLRRLRSASPTADHSTSPTKRKSDDCTPLQSSASLISSVPPRHQTCRAEYPKQPTSQTSDLQSGISKAAHFPGKARPVGCNIPAVFAPLTVQIFITIV